MICHAVSLIVSTLDMITAHTRQRCLNLTALNNSQRRQLDQISFRGAKDQDSLVVDESKAKLLSDIVVNEGSRIASTVYARLQSMLYLCAPYSDAFLNGP